MANKISFSSVQKNSSRKTGMFVGKMYFFENLEDTNIL